MLEKEHADRRRQEQKTAIGERAERHAGQRDAGRVRLDGALDVPFMIELLQAARNRLGRRVAVAGEVGERLPANPLVDVRRSVARDAIERGGQHAVGAARAVPQN